VVVLVVGLLVVLGVTANAAAGCLTIGMVVVELELDMAGAPSSCLRSIRPRDDLGASVMAVAGFGVDVSAALALAAAAATSLFGFCFFHGFFFCFFHCFRLRFLFLFGVHGLSGFGCVW
jgi:hypothetical protein